MPLRLLISSVQRFTRRTVAWPWRRARRRRGSGARRARAAPGACAGGTPGTCTSSRVVAGWPHGAKATCSAAGMSSRHTQHSFSVTRGAAAARAARQVLLLPQLSKSVSIVFGNRRRQQLCRRRRRRIHEPPAMASWMRQPAARSDATDAAAETASHARRGQARTPTMSVTRTMPHGAARKRRQSRARPRASVFVGCSLAVFQALVLLRAGAPL